MDTIWKILVALFLLWFAGCTSTFNNDLDVSMGIGEQQQIEFKVIGSVDTTVAVDPWMAAQWVEDSVNGLVAIVVPGWTGIGGLFE